MEQAKSILPRLFQGTRSSVLSELDLIRGYWAESVGPLLADRSTPIKLEGNRLVVKVEGPPWRELLRPMRQQVVDFLRSEFPATAVRRIELRLPEGAGEDTPRRER